MKWEMLNWNDSALFHVSHDPEDFVLDLCIFPTTHNEQQS